MSASDNRHDYGLRVCMNCGKAFTAEKPWQVTCGDDCRKSRAKTLGRMRQHARTTRIADLSHDIGIMDAVLKETCSDFDRAEAMMAQAGGLRHHVWKRPEREEKDKIPTPENNGKESPAKEKASPETAVKDEKTEEPSKSEPEGKPERRYCERMRCWADSLPCGEREECFLSPKCASIPDGMLKLTHRCETCGKPLENVKGGRRFCSAACRIKASKRKQGAGDDRLWNAANVEENL